MSPGVLLLRRADAIFAQTFGANDWDAVRRIAVITTGGTIASSRVEGGAARVTAGGRDVVAGVRIGPGVELSVRETMALNSFAMTFRDMDRIHRAVRAALSEPDVDGVVVTHGTDTLEETAALLAFNHRDPRPVVLTGAIRPQDAPEPDGAANLADAAAVAAAPLAVGAGVLVCLAGRVHEALGTVKRHNDDPDSFADPERSPWAVVTDGRIGPLRPARGPHPLCPRDVEVGAERVAVVSAYPGADRVAYDAEVAAGARGVVLVGTGSGNATPALAAAVREHPVPVLLTSRVPAGTVGGVYGGPGGGADLITAGAVSAGRLRAGQARVLLAALLASGTPVAAETVETWTEDVGPRLVPHP
ncbi:asparaginase domain-containing protein [Pseudonocardia alni]|uniref:asparaginase domain-containing protein n=1 Tax=Pseudonocardia alni TaxID=33907 RepID=UPI0034021E33